MSEPRGLRPLAQVYVTSVVLLGAATVVYSIHQLFAKFRDSGFHFKDLLIALVRSPEFLQGLDNNDKVAQERR